MASEYRTTLFVQVHGKEDLDPICSALRGLFYANGQSNGRATSNKDFCKGVEIEFGAAPSVDAFIKSVESVIRLRVRNRITLERRG
jgi:hypothetical protein